MELSSNNTEWIKFGNIKLVSFIGKDIIFMGSGCHMLFTNMGTREEVLYRADNKSLGEGISVYVGHKNLSLFAFAEKCRNPRIFVVTYPDFSTICILDKQSTEDFLALTFSESELLITLNDIISNRLIVWNWRSMQKLAVLHTDITDTDQLLKCSLSTPVYFAQIRLGSSKLNLWDVAMCGKKCFVNQHRIKLLNNAAKFTDILWTTDSALFVLDELGHVYTLTIQNEVIMVIEWRETGNSSTSFTWYKSGLTILGPNKIIKHFRKSGDWVCDWQVISNISLNNITSNYKDILLGITDSGDLTHFELSDNKFRNLKLFQNDFKELCLIYPTTEYFITLQSIGNIILWRLASGEMKARKILEEQVCAIKANPVYPYVAVCSANGELQLLSVYNPDFIKPMTSFNLSREELNGIYFSQDGNIIVTANMNQGEFFIIEGEPGNEMKIRASINAEHRICDYFLNVFDNCVRLFALYVTSNTFVAGNRLVCFTLEKWQNGTEIKEYCFEKSYLIYTHIYENTNNSFYATCLTSKCIHLLKIPHEGFLVKVVNTINTDHHMKNNNIHIDKHYALTYGYDGFIIIQDVRFAKILAKIMPHYRMYGGITKAYIGMLGQYIVSLGRDNTLIGTSLINKNIKKHQLTELYESLNNFKVLFEKPTIGFSPTGKFEGHTWFEMKRLQQIHLEEINARSERLSIIGEFKDIKNQVKALLTENLQLKEDDKVEMEDFYIDSSLFEEIIEEHQEECRKTEEYLQALIASQNKVYQWIKSFCWDKMKVQGQVIKGIFANFEVGNYALLPKDKHLLQNWYRVNSYRKLENQLSEDETFKASLSREERQEQDVNLETDFNDSLTHKFVTPLPGHYNQFQICSFLQSEYETYHNLVQIRKLKQWFNKQFDEVKALKVKEVNFVIEKNAHLRHILSELNYFAGTKFNTTVDDPKWSPLENPESILKVEDSEVKVARYVSPEEQATIDAAKAEEIRINQLFKADDFPERALMNLMGGVLEVSWEEDLKKEIVQPRCMVIKNPERYTEDEKREVLQYEEEVRFLKSERLKYINMLQHKRVALCKSLKERINNFNNHLASFLTTKIEVESAVAQESLKIDRIRLRSLKRIHINKKEEEIILSIKQNQTDAEKLQMTIASIQETLQDMHSNADSLHVKEKLIEKMFRREFFEAPQVIQEQALKLYKRRPKINIHNVSSITLSHEVTKCITTSQEKPIILTPECLEYLKALDTLDLYINVPLAVDENTYALVCKHRRLKIENELKVRTSELEISEAETTLQMFQKLLSRRKEQGQKLQIKLNQLRKDRFNFMHDMEIQIVLEQGLIEVPTTGSISDFDNAILVSRNEIDNINKIILRAGTKKIKILQDIMITHSNIKVKEWEHQYLKLKIEDLRDRIKDIESIRVTKNVQLYLKQKTGDNAVFENNYEMEIEKLKAPYIKLIDKKKEDIKLIQLKIDNVIQKRKIIDEQIRLISKDLSEYQTLRGENLEERENNVIKMRDSGLGNSFHCSNKRNQEIRFKTQYNRMATLLKKWKLLDEIEKNQKSILMMQTEVELLKLRTYPTLPSKVAQ